MIGIATVPVGAATRPGGEVTVALVDDTRGRALFDGTARLTPRHPQTACLAMRAMAGAATDEIAMTARHIGGAWPTALELSVDVGSGGRAGDCSGFHGITVWQGSLADLATRRVPLGWRPASDPVRTIRVVARFVDVASGSRADGPPAGSSVHADLVWMLTSPAPPGPTPPTNATSRVPTPTRSASVHPTAPSEYPTRSTGRAADVQDLTIEPPVPWLAQAADAVRGVARSPQYPLLAFGLALGFLLVQDRIDRRDPKLAMAARWQRDNELVFPPRWSL